MLVIMYMIYRRRGNPQHPYGTAKTSQPVFARNEAAKQSIKPYTAAKTSRTHRCRESARRGDCRIVPCGNSSQRRTGGRQSNPQNRSTMAKTTPHYLEIPSRSRLSLSWMAGVERARLRLSPPPAHPLFALRCRQLRRSLPGLTSVRNFALLKFLLAHA